jgi:5-formaminoimidazole-4-carboxamide-1-beta-D-ribofuranosyl 5'-monophosphate synthetase
LESEEVRKDRKKYLSTLKKFLLFNDIPIDIIGSFEELQILKELKQNDLESMIMMPVINSVKRQYFYNRFRNSITPDKIPFQEHYFQTVLD